MWRRSVSALLGVMALSDGLLGCDLGCDKEDDEPMPYVYGRVNVDRTIYETNDWNESFVKFSAGRRLSIEHGLGGEPEIFTWLAFDPLPFAQKRSAAESAGNMVIILKNQDGVIVVRNDTCQDFWLRLVAISPGEFESPSGQGGSDGAGGSE
jgi:hypothetical protein